MFHTNGHFGPGAEFFNGIGHKQSFTGTMPKVRLQIRKRTFHPIAAAHYDLCVGYVGFAIWKRKQLFGADFVAL